jgi:hypothetical protein
MPISSPVESPSRPRDVFTELAATEFALLPGAQRRAALEAFRARVEFLATNPEALDAATQALDNFLNSFVLVRYRRRGAGGYAA